MSAYKGGCHTTDPTHWHGRTVEQWVQDGWRMRRDGDQMIREPVMVKVRTDWLPRSCGVVEQAGFHDNGCDGCSNRPGAK